MTLLEKYNGILRELETISETIGRSKDNIKIIAVTKTFPSSVIQEAIDQGLTLFGENKVQEAKKKIQELKGSFVFHLIGHLQTNKASDAVRLFDIIHSIDKESTAAKVDIEAKKINKIQKILIQVNTTEEETKSGTRPDAAISLIKKIIGFKNIEILGLMTIGPFIQDEKKMRESFSMLKNLLAEVNKELGTDMKELSMGMSSDYSIAVEEGATMVRIGSAIFGQRNYLE